MLDSILRELTASPWSPILFGAAAAAIMLGVGILLLNRNPKRSKPRVIIVERNYQELESASLLQNTAAERRGSMRRGGKVVEVLISDAEVLTKPYDGLVLDRSTGGMCLFVEVEVAVGTILSVKAKNAPDTTPWTQVEVRNCRKVSEGFEVGCQFLKTPPWSVLLLFG
ncbi:MAG: PilZ domain-containing protein [Gemmataceae bacterium]